MTDRYLLEAMREVDELTPACPPIAPPRDSLMERCMTSEPGTLIEVDLTMREIANQLAPLRHYELMQNAANRSMTPEELARYNQDHANAANDSWLRRARDMHNAARPTEALDSDGRPIGRT